MRRLVYPAIISSMPDDLLSRLPADLADRGGSCDWQYSELGWVVNLLVPERAEFRGVTLQEALAFCLVWLMVEGFSGATLT